MKKKNVEENNKILMELVEGVVSHGDHMAYLVTIYLCGVGLATKTRTFDQLIKDIRRSEEAHNAAIEKKKAGNMIIRH